MSDDLQADVIRKITPADVRKADAGYRPFPSFAEWARLSVDPEYWAHELDRLNSERTGATDESVREATEHTMRLAAIDTGAIEGLYSVDRGFTVSVAEQAATWTVQADERGVNVRSLFEAQMAGYQLVFDVATGSTPLSEAFVRELHATITAAQDKHRVLTPNGWQEQALKHGEYKSQPNHPWGPDGPRHSYAPVADTPPEVHRLIEELRTAAFAEAHPVLQASYVHYAFVLIHPFADGNGRVARALASIYLYRVASIPLLIYADQTPAYLDALIAADEGRAQEFVDFVLDRAIAAMARFTELLRLSSQPPLSGSVRALESLHFAFPGVRHGDVDEAAQTLFGAFRSEYDRQIRELTLPSSVRFEWSHLGGGRSAPAGYRSPIAPSVGSQRVVARSDAPANATVPRDFDVYVAMGNRPRDTVMIRRRGDDTTFVAAYRDVRPEIASDVAFRLSAWCEGHLRSQLADLAEAAKNDLRARGYSQG